MPRSTALALAAAAFFAGGWLLPALVPSAQASGPSGYTQCIGQSVAFLRIGQEGDVTQAKAIASPVPKGWTPVGGTYSGMVLCQ